jgi:colanic acid/amylovoran biosynthesis glycosyltransferase
MSTRIALVTSGFPRRSETFLLNELLALDAHGALAGVFATKPGDGTPPQPGAERLADRVEILPPGSPAEQADALARRLDGARVAGIHAYFAHTPAAVARAAAARLGVPFGFSVHARDARKLPSAELGERARAAACVIACNADVAGDVRRAGGRPRVIPHGVDLARFRPAAPRRRTGAVQLLAVGRLVPKKGFDLLVDAIARVDAPVRLRIVGAGPEEAALRASVAAHDLGAVVTLAGPRTHAELPAEYAAADIVCVPSVEDETGDRDGLPNVALEAMASGRAIVAGAVGALPAAIEHGMTGLLVPPGHAGALAHAIAALARDAALRDRLGRAARTHAEREYGLERCTDRFLATLAESYA